MGVGRSENMRDQRHFFLVVVVQAWEKSSFSSLLFYQQDLHVNFFFQKCITPCLLKQGWSGTWHIRGVKYFMNTVYVNIFFEKRVTPCLLKQDWSGTWQIRGVKYFMNIVFVIACECACNPPFAFLKRFSQYVNFFTEPHSLRIQQLEFPPSVDGYVFLGVCRIFITAQHCLKTSYCSRFILVITHPILQ